MATTNKRDYYEILSVEKTAPEEEVKRAYRKLVAVKFHIRTRIPTTRTPRKSSGS